MPRWAFVTIVVAMWAMAFGLGLIVGARSVQRNEEAVFQMGYREGWSDNETERWKRY